MHFSIFHWFEIKLLDTTVSQLLSRSSAFLFTSASLQSSCPHSFTILSSTDTTKFPMSPHDLVKSQWPPDFQIQGHFSVLILLDLSTAFGYIFSLHFWDTTRLLPLLPHLPLFNLLCWLLVLLLTSKFVVFPRAWSQALITSYTLFIAHLLQTPGFKYHPFANESQIYLS